MFAAASGARLARKKDGVKKQNSAGHIEGLHANYRIHHQHPFLKYDGPNIPSNRNYGYPQRRLHYYTSSECDSALRLSSSYVDFNGRTSKLGHPEFEGKAAWQDRDQPAHDLERRDSIGVSSDATLSHRAKQKEAHRRWVKRNRIHDSSFGDCSSDDEFFSPYGVQSAAANALLYIGLGTMCIGMIIAFVGTGEKGFKTMELRLIGPSLIGAGVMIIILRIMLCVCPSNCIRKHKHKHKHKNSTNKLNSEGAEINSHDNKKEENKNEEIQLADRTSLLKDEHKKRVSIVTAPTGDDLKKQTTSFLENEQKSSSKLIIPTINLNNEEEERQETEVQPFEPSSFDEVSIESAKLQDDHLSALSITSLTNGLMDEKEDDEDEDDTSESRKLMKFKATRLPRHKSNELVLCPSNLADTKELEESI